MYSAPKLGLTSLLAFVQEDDVVGLANGNRFSASSNELCLSSLESLCGKASINRSVFVQWQWTGFSRNSSESTFNYIIMIISRIYHLELEPRAQEKVNKQSNLPVCVPIISFSLYLPRVD